MDFELSESTKVRIAADMLRHYYKNRKKKDVNFERIEEALEKIEKEEPWYYKALEMMYLEERSVSDTYSSLFCAERTFFYKRDKMLLRIFEETMAGIKFPVISFL